MSTTREIIYGLNELLQKNFEAAEGFQKAADVIESEKVRRFLKYKSNQKRRFAAAIRDEILLIGGKPVSTGSLKGKSHRFWIDLKATATTQDTQGILQSCEFGENKAIDEYKAFLKNSAVPLSLRSRLINQQNEISQTLVEIGYLEEVYETL